MIRWQHSFSDADWQDTPEAVKKDFIRMEEILLLFGQRLKELEEELNQLKTRVNKNSTNSDKPPSTDSPYRKRAKKSKKKGRAGAKVGHKGHRVKLSEPTKTGPLFPDKCKCGSETFTECEPFYINQEIELPEIRWTSAILPCIRATVLIVDERLKQRFLLNTAQDMAYAFLRSSPI
jgi:transposase